MKIKLFAVLLLSALCSAQDKSKELKPTEVQQLKLETAQKDLIIQNMNNTLLQKELDEGKANSNALYTKLLNTCADIVRENKWLSGTTCDPQTLKFAEPKKETVTPPQVKKESK